MAEIRHLENRHFFAVGGPLWIKISQIGAG